MPDRGAWYPVAPATRPRPVGTDVPTVRIPAPLRPATDDRAEVAVEGADVRAVLADLVARHPAVGERVWDERGRLHRFVNVFVGDDDVRDLRGLDTAVDPDDVVTIVPAVAGGAG